MILTLDEIISAIAMESLDIQKDFLNEIKTNPDLFHTLLKYYNHLHNHFKSICSEEFNKLYVLLNVFVLLKKENAFYLILSFINKIDNLSEEKFYDEFNELDFSWVLYHCVKNKWILLKKLIENPKIDVYWQIASMHVLSFCVADRKVERKIAVDYLKKLLCKNIAANKNCTLLVLGLFLIHTKETIEEIKDAYARFLVSDVIFIDDIIDFHKIDPEKLIKDLKKTIPTKNDLLDLLRYFYSDEKDENSNDVEKEKTIAQKTSSNKTKKRKKNNSFYNNKKELLKSDDIDLFLPAIDFEINDNPLLNEIDESDRNLLSQFFEQNTRTNVDDKSFSILLSLKEKYSHISLFWHLINSVYVNKGMINKSLEILFIIVEKFPDDLMTKINYGQYLLRRGEYDKIAKLFNNKFTLQALYPEKESFYIDDFQMFADFMITYCAAIGKFKIAHFYLDGLKQFTNDKQTISELEKEIEVYFHYHQKKETFNATNL